MKIVAGLGCIDDYIPLVNAGADEFFCGYIPYQWNKQFGVMQPLNRREVLYYNVQIGAITDLEILHNMVRHFRVPVKITMNSLYYAPSQYPMIEKIIEDCINIGFDTFIMADPALILHLRNKKIPCKIHLSGEIGEVNRGMMKIFHELNISRFIFHRKNTLKDMGSCISANEGKGLEYEAFVLNEWCHYTGGFCNSLHCDELTHLCKVPYHMVGNSQEMKELSYSMDKEEELQEGYVTGATGCGLCALWEMQKVGVTHLKLVGRGNHTAYMEEDIRQLKKALELLEKSDSCEDYKKRIQTLLFQKNCSGICYYRE